MEDVDGRARPGPGEQMGGHADRRSQKRSGWMVNNLTRSYPQREPSHAEASGTAKSVLSVC